MKVPIPMTPGQAIRSIDGSAWDVIVLGAGPCGSAAAFRCASDGARTLLLDRSVFPREKTCGCCLSAEGVRLASQIRPGFADRIPYFDHLEVRTRRARCATPVPPGVVLARSALDAALAQGAADAGALFLPGAHAHLAGATDDHRTLELHADSQSASVRGSVIVAAVGLSGRPGDRGETARRIIRRGAPIGVSTILPWPDAPIPHATVAMHVGAGGYVGLARLNESLVSLAAALRPSFIRDAGGPAEAVRRTLDEAGVTPCETLDTARWLGAGTLTRRTPTPAAHRLLIAGDAAGYAEPFSGEGMSMALESGFASGAIAADAALNGWRAAHEIRWRAVIKQRVRPRHRRCTALTRVIARPAMAGLAIRLLGQDQGVTRELACLFAAPTPVEAAT